MLEEVETAALKRAFALAVADEMRGQEISKAALARPMSTSRAALDRLLDPEKHLGKRFRRSPVRRKRLAVGWSYSWPRRLSVPRQRSRPAPKTCLYVPIPHSSRVT